jgi:hypothetical protein
MRLAVARPAGVEDLLDEVVAYERSAVLRPADKAALRIADAFLVRPSTGRVVGPPALEHFSVEQMLELMFKLALWIRNKESIALGRDAPLDENRPTVGRYERGTFVPLGAG